MGRRGRKTGYRWRAERGGLPPLRVTEDRRGSRYLSMLERERIAVLRRQGCSVREVARRPRRGRIAADPQLRDLVQARLTEDWSPQSRRPLASSPVDT